jgi:hypothetical protein
MLLNMGYYPQQKLVPEFLKSWVNPDLDGNIFTTSLGKQNNTNTTNDKRTMRFLIYSSFTSSSLWGNYLTISRLPVETVIRQKRKDVVLDSTRHVHIFILFLA